MKSKEVREEKRPDFKHLWREVLRAEPPGAIIEKKSFRSNGARGIRGTLKKAES
jgi:hypothetical protein